MPTTVLHVTGVETCMRTKPHPQVSMFHWQQLPNDACGQGYMHARLDSMQIAVRCSLQN